MDCVFCAIRDGQIPAVKIHEDDRTIAFMDINPISDGHTLVVPKQHATNIFDIAPEDLTATVLVAQSIARGINRALQPDGLKLMQSNGAVAGQTVDHFHLHLIPLWEDKKGANREQLRDPARIARMAESIKSAL